ncbi:Uma2 family endonuclease [Moorena producens]|nr:hypothetical protein BI334_29565 [Moorena producens 3L]
MYQTDPPRPPRETMPTMYDLPSEDPDEEELDPTVHPRPVWETMPTMYDLPSEDPEEPGLPDEFHDFQPQLLRETCQPPNYPREEMFIGTDLNLYYDSHHLLWHKRPDWFLVLGVTPAQQQKDLRWSYVVWQEGRAPFLVVELLSPGTEAEDLGQTLRSANKPPTKWQAYEQYMRIPYYVVFDRYQNQLRVFQLMPAQYQEVELSEPKFWIRELELGLGVWLGKYQETEGLWLRWYDEAGNWIETLKEHAQQESQRAEQESQRAEQESQRAEQERQRAERLAEKLRTLGINPDDL